LFRPAAFPDYSLLDSGHGEKLERFGARVLRRPDPQALWRPRRPRELWDSADLAFERDPTSGGRRGSWKSRTGAAPEAWTIPWGAAHFVLRPTAFKHVGIFPEQAANWSWLAGLDFGTERPRLLNLFGYTGAASIVALQAGFEVTHVDASKASLVWARENLAASGLGPEAMRVLLDDAVGFARREERRGSRYELIILDPPHHGRGPRGETWDFESGIAPLLETCAALLAERAALCLSAYAIGISPWTLRNLSLALPAGRLEVDELVLPEDVEGREPARFLPAGFCARWTRDVAVGR